MTHVPYLPGVLEAYFAFLDGLRESGVTNMYAAAPYLSEQFGLDADSARDVLSMWQDSYQPDAAVGERARAALILLPCPTQN